VYKQSFSCKINLLQRTIVRYIVAVLKQTATKLQKSPAETVAQSRILLQMRDSDSGPKPRLRGIPTRTPYPCYDNIIWLRGIPTRTPYPCYDNIIWLRGIPTRTPYPCYDNIICRRIPPSLPLLTVLITYCVMMTAAHAINTGDDVGQ